MRREQDAPATLLLRFCVQTSKLITAQRLPITASRLFALSPRDEDHEGAEGGVSEEEEGELEFAGEAVDDEEHQGPEAEGGGPDGEDPGADVGEGEGAESFAKVGPMFVEDEPGDDEGEDERGGEEQLVADHFEEEGGGIISVAEDLGLEPVEAIDDEPDDGPHGELVEEFAHAGVVAARGAEAAFQELGENAAADDGRDGGKEEAAFGFEVGDLVQQGGAALDPVVAANHGQGESLNDEDGGPVDLQGLDGGPEKRLQVRFHADFREFRPVAAWRGEAIFERFILCWIHGIIALRPWACQSV